MEPFRDHYKNPSSSVKNRMLKDGSLRRGTITLPTSFWYSFASPDVKEAATVICTVLQDHPKTKEWLSRQGKSTMRSLYDPRYNPTISGVKPSDIKGSQRKTRSPTIGQKIQLKYALVCSGCRNAMDIRRKNPGEWHADHTWGLESCRSSWVSALDAFMVKHLADDWTVEEKAHGFLQQPLHAQHLFFFFYSGIRCHCEDCIARVSAALNRNDWQDVELYCNEEGLDFKQMVAWDPNLIPH